MLVLAITVGAVVLGLIAARTIVVFKQDDKAQKVAESVASVGKVGLEQLRLALVDDNKVDAKEAKAIFSSMLDQIKKEIAESAADQ